MIQQQAYDAFGFKASKLTLAVEACLQDSEQDQKDALRWKKLLPQLPHLKLKDEKKLLEEVKAGIPNQIRAKVWSQLITPPLKEYGQVVVTEYLKEIDRDTNRTIPTNKHDKQIQVKLRQVLNRLAYAFPDMGYCQGLNFIAGNLLLILSPEQTYNTMFHILYWQRHELLMSDISYIHQKIYCLDKLIKKHYPKLYSKLVEMEIETILYACSWFVTLFNNVLPCQYSFRILQLYFLQGQKLIYKVCLQILKEKKRTVKRMADRQEIIGQLKNYQEFNKSMDKRFFNELCLIKVTNKELEEYQKEYQKHKHT